MSTISSSFLRQINTKYEAYRLINDPTRLYILLYSKYYDIEEDFNILISNQLIFNLPTKLNCAFKENKYFIINEYLKRSYETKESLSRIPKLIDYYKNYHTFFCRPTLRNIKLGGIISNFKDKKAEIFYKNNYKDSKENFSFEDINNKKNSSLSLTSFDNITNNKIIFDKHTKKILDKSETELKNNNYYNTLILESSRSFIPNNNGLISKRRGDDNSFEKCIHALIEYQYNKNKKLKNKIDKKIYLKNKKIKKFLVYNSEKNSQIKKVKDHSYRINNASAVIKKYNQYNRLINKNKEIKSAKISDNNINIAINKGMKSVKKKKSLYTLMNVKSDASSSGIMGYKINKLNNNINQNILNNIKEYNINRPITSKNEDTRKNRTNFATSNCSSKNKINKYDKFTEYLLQSIKRQERNLFHKKNCLSIGDNQNLFFNFLNGNKKIRITKKKVILNKNLKINNTHFNYSIQNLVKINHSKNKTFDFRTINNSNSNNFTKTDNINCTEDLDTSIKKNQKKKTLIIHIDNNTNLQKNNFAKITNNSKKKIIISSPPSDKLYKKISYTLTNSKEKKKKMTVKKSLPINTNCNVKKVDKNFQHKKNNKSMFYKENNYIFNLAKPINKLNKHNICLSPHPEGNTNLNLNNINSNLSPVNKLPKNLIYFKTNSGRNMNNNIYIKKCIHKNYNLINHKKNNTLGISYNYNTLYNKEISLNNSLSKNTNISNTNLMNNTTNNINTENKKVSRNKKLNMKSNFNYLKKSGSNTKHNSTLNNNEIPRINYNLIINNDLKHNINNKGNINISIGKSNINIKDSILHIEKLYINKDNNKRKSIKTCENINHFYPQKKLEIDLNSNIIKVGGKNTKKNKEKIKILDYPHNSLEANPQNIINVHRNLNLTNNKNFKELKRKIK